MAAVTAPPPPSPPLPPTHPPRIDAGADEISALVLDPGQCWTRTGFAGEDTPKTVTPSHYGLVRGTDDDDDCARKLYFGDNDVHAVRAGMEILNPMSDGIGASPNRSVAIREGGREGGRELTGTQWPTGTWRRRCGATR